MIRKIKGRLQNTANGLLDRARRSGRRNQSEIEASISQPDVVKSDKRCVLIPLIDAVKEKNMHQFRGLARHGYSFTVLTNDQTGNSRDAVAGDPGIDLHICDVQSSRIRFIWQLIKLIRAQQFVIAELYPDSYLQLLIAGVLKVFRIRILIIARGAELSYVNREFSWCRALAFRLTYALADAVIYKELYMVEMLSDMRKDPVFFLPNSIELPELVSREEQDRCRFLFMNTFKPFRYPELVVSAFIKLLQDPDLGNRKGIRLDIVGLVGETASAAVAAKETQLQRMLEGCEAPIALHPWSNAPAAWMSATDVFLLPSDIVFLNYALLEAMGRGIPAIVSASQGADLIVNNGVNGYIVPFDVDMWASHMKRLCLQPELRTSMGIEARRTVANRFSYDSYVANYLQIYARATRTGGSLIMQA